LPWGGLEVRNGVIPAPGFDEITEVAFPLALRFCNSSLIVKANIETAKTQRTIIAMGFGFVMNQQDNYFMQGKKQRSLFI
jgi:hypothetical protein